jgi:multicomponent Na+:H+ antiporter subunit G
MSLLGIVTVVFVVLGVVFMLIASLGIVRLPDFYMRMSAITKAATLGLGLILIAASIYFDDFGVIVKAFIIITFMLLTSPVGAHAISRAAYKQGVGFKGRTIIDELGNMLKKVMELEISWANEKKIEVGEELVTLLMALPEAQGGSFKHAIRIAQEMEEVSPEVSHRLLGVVYSKMRLFSKAEKLFVRSCQEGYYSNKSVFALQNFYVEQRLYHKAIDLLEKALVKHPNNFEFLLEVAHLSHDFGIRLRYGLECSIKLCDLPSEKLPSEIQLSAAMYKRYLTQKIGLP